MFLLLYTHLKLRHIVILVCVHDQKYEQIIKTHNYSHKRIPKCTYSDTTLCHTYIESRQHFVVYYIITHYQNYTRALLQPYIYNSRLRFLSS